MHPNNQVNIDRAISDLGEAGVNLDLQVNLREYTWFKSGGMARMIAQPTSINSLAETIRILNSLQIPFKIIGETTNLLFLDDRTYSCLVCTKSIGATVLETKANQIVTETGAMLPSLSRFALHSEIGGFTGFEGIPGTIGGAVFMNAGGYGTNVQQLLQKVEVIMPDGRIESIDVEKLEFSYRNSVFKKGTHPGIIVRAFFRAVPGNQKKSYSRMEEIHANRHRHYEYMYPNLGSIFAGSVYRSLGKKDPLFRVAAAMFYFFNYQFRINKRETPINRKWLNDLAVKRFGIKFEKQPFSDKSLNVLVNNNHHTDDLLAYIDQMKSLVGMDVPIENEIVNPF